MKNWKYIDGAEVGNAKYDIAFQGQIDGNSEQYYFVYDYQTDPGAHRPVKKFKTRDEAKAYAKKLNEKEKVGNSKVGNADPRIASLKQKLQALIKQDDTGALKDVLRLAEDTIKDLKARKEKLMKDVDEIEKDLIGWQDIKTEAKWNL